MLKKLSQLSVSELFQGIIRGITAFWSRYGKIVYLLVFVACAVIFGYFWYYVTEGVGWDGSRVDNYRVTQETKIQLNTMTVTRVLDELATRERRREERDVDVPDPFASESAQPGESQEREEEEEEEESDDSEDEVEVDGENDQNQDTVQTDTPLTEEQEEGFSEE
jgi:hypothetical protein